MERGIKVKKIRLNKLKAETRSSTLSQIHSSLFPFVPNTETILNSLTEQVVVQDIKHKILWANKAAADAANANLETIIGKPCYEVWRRLKEPCLDCPVVEALCTGRSHTSELISPRNKSFLIRGDPVLNAEGNVIALIETTLDTTERRLAEKELMAERENFRNSFETLPFGVQIINPAGKLVYMNQTMLNMWGYATIEQLREVQLEQAFTPESLTLVLKMYKQRKPGTIPPIHELTIICKNGRLRDLRVYSKEMVWQGERCIQLLYEDITERQQAEEALKESEYKLKEAQISGNIGYWEYNLATQKIVWSDQTYRLYERDMGLGPPSVDEESAYYSADQNARLKEFFRHVSTSGKPVEYDMQAQLPSGRTAYFSATMHPVKDTNGQITGLFGTVQDITERKIAEEALRKERGNFRNSLEISPFGVHIINFQGDLLYANRTLLNMWGYNTIEDEKAEPLEKRFTSDSIAFIKNELENKRRPGDPDRQYELTAIRKDGQIRSLQVHSKEIIWNGERAIQVIYRDITEQRIVEKELIAERENFRNSFETLPFGVEIVSLTGGLSYVNKTMLDMWGYNTLDQLKTLQMKQAFTPESVAFIRNMYMKRKPEEIPPIHELTIIRQNGVLRDVRIYTKEIIWNGEKCHQMLFEDITERKQMEVGIHQLNNTLELIRNINQLIVRMDNEAELLQMGCNLIVKNERYKLAWIGIIQANSYEVMPTAMAGKAVDYLNAIRVRYDDSPQGNGPIGTAIKTRKLCVVTDSLNDPRFQPWREKAIQKGLRSVIAFPLKVQDKVIGALAIYSSTADTFGEKELDLLSELAADLSLGVEKIRHREEQRKFEQELADEAVRRRVLVEQSSDGIVVLDQDGRVYEANNRFAEMIGYSVEEVRHLTVWDWEYQHTPGQTRDMIQSIDGKGNHFESKHRRKNGSIYDVEISSSAANFAGQKLIFCVCRDITERKRMENELRQSEDRFATIFRNSLDPIVLTSVKEGRIIEANDSFFHITGTTSKEAIGRTIDELNLSYNDPVDRNRHAELLLKQGRVVDMDVRFHAPNGGLRDCLISSEIVELKDGKYVLSIIRDITDQKQAVNALRESERKYRELTDQLPQTICEADSQGNITFVNQTALKTFGYTVDEFRSGLSIWAMIDETDLDRARKILVRVLVGENPGGIELTARRKDGSTFPMLVYVSPIMREAMPTGIRTVVIDITERKKTEETLRFSDAVLKSMHDAIFAMDSNTAFIHWNDVCEKVFGIKASDAIGKKFNDVMTMVEDYPGQNEERIRTLISKGYNREEQLYRTPHGDVWVDVHTQAIELKGQASGWVTLAMDISERKKMENELRHSEEKFSKIWRSSPDPLMLISMDDSCIVEVNESFLRMTGYTLDEVIGQTTLGLNLWASTADHDSYFEQHRKYGHVPNTDVDIRVKSGEMRNCVVLGELLELPDGPHILGIIRDITDIKKMQDSLLITDRLASIGELTSGIAHELNNPLTSVIGFSELLLEKQLPDDIKEDVELMCREAKRTADVVKNMLTFARKHPSTREQLSINNILNATLDMRSYEHRLSNIRVIRQFMEGLPEIQADHFQLQQVFLNIIINSEYFMIKEHNGGILTVVTEKSGDFIKVSITDDGPGISAENLNHLFDPFFTTKPVGKGTGLGLSICHGIVAEHNGRIYAESTLGKGSTFIIELPINAQ